MFFLIFYFFFFNLLDAKSENQKGKSKNILKISTKSDKMEINIKENNCELIGNAEVLFTNGKNINIFRSPKITLFYSSNDLKNMTNGKAVSGVFFKTNDFDVSANECIFNSKYVIFDKNICINNKKIGIMHADHAIYDINTKKIDITSQKRVQLKINKAVHMRRKK